nr:hypothetical protein [Tanacetum cinerariifolium]
ATINRHNDHHSTLASSYKSIAWNLGPRLIKIEETQSIIKTDLATANSDTSKFKFMVSGNFKDFKASFSTSLSNAYIPTYGPTEVNAPVGRGI